MECGLCLTYGLPAPCEECRAKRREALDEMVRLSEEMGLYELDAPVNPGSQIHDLPD